MSTDGGEFWTAVDEAEFTVQVKYLERRTHELHLKGLTIRQIMEKLIEEWDDTEEECWFDEDLTHVFGFLKGYYDDYPDAD